MPTPKELLAFLRTKSPQLAALNDDDLLAFVREKHPDWLEAVEAEAPERPFVERRADFDLSRVGPRLKTLAEPALHPIQNAPMLASLGAAIASQGTSIPMQVGLTALAGAGGQALKRIVAGEAVTPQELATGAVEGAAPTAGLGLIAKTAGPATRFGTRVMRSILRPAQAFLRDTPTFTRTGDLNAAEQWLAEEVVKRGGLNKTTQQAVKAELADTGRQVNEALAAVPTRVNLQRITEPLEQELATPGSPVRATLEPGPGMRAQERVIEAFKAHPDFQGGAAPTVPAFAEYVRKRQRQLRDVYQAPGEAGTAEHEASVRLLKAAKEELHQLAPETRALHARQAELIPIQEAVTEGLRSIERRQPIQLGEEVLMSSGGKQAIQNPALGLALLLNRPAMASRMSQLAHRWGETATRAPRLDLALRTAILELLGQRQPETR